MRTRSYFSKLKGVRKQKRLGSTRLYYPCMGTRDGVNVNSELGCVPKKAALICFDFSCETE